MGEPGQSSVKLFTLADKACPKIMQGDDSLDTLISGHTSDHLSESVKARQKPAN